MTTTPFLKKLASTGLLIAAIGGAGAVSGGCAYGGVASTPDGTIIIARNGALGAARHVYVCKVVGEDLKCTETTTTP